MDFGGELEHREFQVGLSKSVETKINNILSSYRSKFPKPEITNRIMFG